MARMIDQIRASRLPSNLMQFAARGALQVSPAENIEILVYLARYNKVFGEVARMTLAGWDEKASLAVASDPQTAVDVLNYLISPDNLRPHLLPTLLENPSVREDKLAVLARAALRDTLDIMLKSERVRSLPSVVNALKGNPYLKREEAAELGKAHAATVAAPASEEVTASSAVGEAANESQSASEAPEAVQAEQSEEATVGVDEESVFSYLQEHAGEIAAEGEKPFQPLGGFVDLAGQDSSHTEEAPKEEPHEDKVAADSRRFDRHPAATAPGQAPKRQNTLQKINSLDVKGRIQLALKGNKEERSILIRDGTKVVALAVLEAPKISDGEVEKFASQKNVLEAVLRQIPLKRRFMKDYIVVRNLVANPRTPLDLSLGLMKNLLVGDLKNLSSNKEISDTVRKLALKMFKQKLDAANKK
jgi:hypothetical protein